MKYRAEIDGLRAVAVLPVILFHAGYSSFSGGFVGVDVFFVISGYLITTIILTELERDTFSLSRFYERRARRILPALFLVLFASVICAWFWLLPSDMWDFSLSLMAVSTFTSNILFLRQTGYWGVVNELKPLLHTWSLAVEEQYYILFPLFMMFMWRFRKRWIFGSFILIAVTSLLFSQWQAYNDPSANFFLLPTRGWEIAIGAIIAFFFLYQQQAIEALRSHQTIAELMSFVGLILIGYAIFAFDETVPFPSFYTLIPTVGTGLIILFSSPKVLSGKLLGIKPLVSIGLISYSAYLWHQPLFAFARHRSLTEPSALLFATLAVISLLLAYLSWKYVESPFRAKGKIGRKAIFRFSEIGLIMFVAVGMAGYKTNGFMNRPTKNQLTAISLEEKRAVNFGLSASCEGTFTLSPDCRTSDEPEILVWGDSYAMHLVQGIMASNPDARIIQMTKTSCGPFFDIAPVIDPQYPVSWAQGCLEFTGKVRAWLKENTTVKYAVLSSPFQAYISGDNQLLFRNDDLEDATISIAIKEFAETLDELKSMGITPVIFSPPPKNGLDLGRCLAHAEWMGFDLDQCDFGTNEISQHSQDSYRFLENFADNYLVIRLDSFICDLSLCKTHAGSTFIYRDTGHLALEGSALLGKKYDFYGIIVQGSAPTTQ